MKALHFEAVIHADPETIWNAMTAPDTFNDWTSAFAEGSHYEGSWNEGEGIRFLTPDGSGMSSVVTENRPYEFLSLEHLGSLKNGALDTDSDETRKWAHAHESYRFRAVGDATELEVDLDVAPDYEQFMRETWPKALARLKTICESPATH